jgi:large subunit ribosomal protein L4e
MSRPLVTVQSPSGKSTTTAFPEVFLSPIRTDIVNDVHTKMNKNHRQPYAVSSLAGEDTSAVSWGTGRAVSRIPRVNGGGSHRSGQGAFGNMCRKGRMFAPTKIWRRWHVKVNIDQKRFATCAALAASAVAPLLLARGHRVSQIPEVPLVVADNDINGISKTKDAVLLLKALGLAPELQKVVDSRHVRPGHGKARNRRYLQAKGPLIVYNKTKETSTIDRAFRNIPGVEIGHVRRLNLLKLAPGGHVGRLIIWTESAFNELNDVFGTRKEFSKQKHGFKPPRSVITNCDITRIINSPEVQTQLRQKKKVSRPQKHINPLGNMRVMAKLNPYAVVQKRQHTRETRRLKNRSSEEIKRDVKLRRARKAAEHKKNPRKGFKQLLNSPAIAPVRSDLEIGVLVGNQK